ncbi:MAG: hypothetical protein AAF437_04140 [Pseudomonadota bacterium]
MSKENESRTVQITVLVTPSEKRALDAAKQRWSRSLGSEVHGRIAYTLAMSDEIDFADRSGIVEDPTLAVGELEAYRERLKKRIVELRLEAPSPVEDLGLGLNDIPSAYELLEDSVGKLIEETDLELDNSTFAAIMKPDVVLPLEIKDVELYSAVATAYASSVSMLETDLANDEAPLAKRARSRLGKSRVLLQYWAWAFFILMNFKAERTATIHLNTMLIEAGLSGAEGSLKTSVLLLEKESLALRMAYEEFLKSLSG